MKSKGHISKSKRLITLNAIFPTFMYNEEIKTSLIQFFPKYDLSIVAVCFQHYVFFKKKKPFFLL